MAQRVEQAGGLIGKGLRQANVPVAQQRPQRVPGGVQIRDLPIHPLENLFGGGPHPTTGHAACPARLEERREFPQRKSDSNGTPNELHSFDHRRRVGPEPATGSGRCWQQTHSLVVSN